MDILAAGLHAADPAACVARHLRADDDGLMVGGLRRQGAGDPARMALGDVGLEGAGDLARIAWSDIDRLLLVAVGKAAAAMAASAEAILGERVAGGMIIAPTGTDAASRRAMVLHAGHPLPDPAGLMATRAVLRLLEGTSARDVVLVLLSGGASAMLEQPAGRRMPLVDIAVATSALLSSGATIDEINAVRKHVSAVKGGQLVRAAAPARVVTLVLSDVASGRLDTVGSGPTAPDPTTFADAARVITARGLWGAMPASIGEHLRAGMAGDVPETPKPGDPLFAGTILRTVGDNAGAAEAAAERAIALGYATNILTTRLEGESREAGRFLAAIGREIALDGRPLHAPACLVVGGETTVTLRRLGGSGGRNRELALAAALALADVGGGDGEGSRGSGDPILLAALGTDGADAGADAAGAIVDGTTVARAAAAGLDAAGALERHDSGPFFAALGDALITGPTGTNVRDLVVVLVGEPPAGR